MRKKKMVSVLLALSLMLGVCACGSQSGDSQESAENLFYIFIIYHKTKSMQLIDVACSLLIQLIFPSYFWSVFPLGFVWNFWYFFHL